MCDLARLHYLDFVRVGVLGYFVPKIWLFIKGFDLGDLKIVVLLVLRQETHRDGKLVGTAANLERLNHLDVNHGCLSGF